MKQSISKDIASRGKMTICLDVTLHILSLPWLGFKSTTCGSWTEKDIYWPGYTLAQGAGDKCFTTISCHLWSCSYIHCIVMVAWYMRPDVWHFCVLGMFHLHGSYNFLLYFLFCFLWSVLHYCDLVSFVSCLACICSLFSLCLIFYIVCMWVESMCLAI